LLNYFSTYHLYLNFTKNTTFLLLILTLNFTMSFDINQIKKQIDDVETRLREFPQLRMIHQKTNLPLVPMLAGVAALFALLLYFFSGLRAITTIVAVLYPAYASLKAIETKDSGDDTLWLSYWCIYGIVSVVESITDLLLSWIPMYEFVKMAFYVYLYYLRGATFIYVKLLQPWVRQLTTVEQKLKENMEQMMDTGNTGSSVNSSHPRND